MAFNKILTALLHVNKKTYIYQGVDCTKALFKSIFLLSKNNDVYFIYNNEILSHIQASQTTLGISIKKSIIADSNILYLEIEHNYKTIHIKHIKLFIKIGIQQIYKLYNKDYKPYLLETQPDFIKRGQFDMDIFLKFLNNINHPLGEISCDWVHYNSLTRLSIALFKKYNMFNIKLHIEQNIYNILKNYYFGGRCEIFHKIHVSDVYCIDFISMHTTILLEKYPYGEPTIRTGIDTITEVGFYYIHATSNIEPPILPTRDGVTKYTNGAIEGLYWYEEIKLFVEYGGVITSIDYMISYANYDYIFRDYANHCLTNRKVDDYYKIVYKVIPNNFIGWFGARNLDECRNIAYPIIVSSRARVK
jgi:hypothetical protein